MNLGSGRSLHFQLRFVPVGIKGIRCVILHFFDFEI